MPDADHMLDSGRELNPLAPILRAIVSSFKRHRTVFFLGAGVNLSHRDDETQWVPRETLPSGAELAEYLYKVGELDETADDDIARDLMRTSQYLSVTHDETRLYDELRTVFNHDFEITEIHNFIANLPNTLANMGHGVCWPLVITTNYDDLMDRAMKRAGQNFDKLCYISKGSNQGSFIHIDHNGKKFIVKNANRYKRIIRNFERPVIMNIHGAINRNDIDNDNYVITEDDYIEYIYKSDITRIIPIHVIERLRNSNILFLGYSLRDWNLRVILHRIWEGKRLSAGSWAVQRRVSDLDRLLWEDKNVKLIDMNLVEFIKELQDSIENTSEGPGFP